MPVSPWKRQPYTKGHGAGSSPASAINLENNLMKETSCIHEDYGSGAVLSANRTDDKVLRVFVAWGDVELAGRIGGWYLLDEKEIKIGESNEND